MASSPFLFQRLNLRLLRLKAIGKIIESTYVAIAKRTTIKEHCGLTDDQVKTVAAHLIQTTFGHPRSLLRALKNCRSYDDFMAYAAPVFQNTNIDWAQFGRHLRLYREPLKSMMECVLSDTTTNLTAFHFDKGKKNTTFDVIANTFGIAWEGTIQDAKLYMPAYIKKLVIASVYSLKELLEKVATVMGVVSLNYADVFEMCFLARFQELFGKVIRPCDALPGSLLQSNGLGV